MNRRDFIVVGSASFSAAASGCLGSTEPEGQDDEWMGVAVRPDDLIVGFDDTQVLLIEMIISDNQGRRIPDENQEHHIKIDTSHLARYGGDVENLSVETADQESLPSNTVPPTVDKLDITDGVIDLVVSQLEDVPYEYFLGLELMGFQFTDVGSMSKVKYDIQSPDDYVEAVYVHSDDSGDGNGEFKLIDPQLLPPTLYPERLSDHDQSQPLSIEWLTPEDDELFIDIDMSALDEYGTIEGAVINEEEIRGAVLERATIDNWTVSMRLVPDSDTNYVGVDIAINEIEITTTDRVENLAYEMTVEGDAHETVETESFDIYRAEGEP